MLNWKIMLHLTWLRSGKLVQAMKWGKKIWKSFSSFVSSYLASELWWAIFYIFLLKIAGCIVSIIDLTSKYVWLIQSKYLCIYSIAHLKKGYFCLLFLLWAAILIWRHWWNWRWEDRPAFLNRNFDLRGRFLWGFLVRSRNLRPMQQIVPTC